MQLVSFVAQDDEKVGDGVRRRLYSCVERLGLHLKKCDQANMRCRDTEARRVVEKCLFCLLEVMYGIGWDGQNVGPLVQVESGLISTTQLAAWSVDMETLEGSLAEKNTNIIMVGLLAVRLVSHVTD